MKNIILPKEFKEYFWDCDFKALKFAEYHEFILGRLLKLGGIKAIIWIYRHFSRKDIHGYLKERGRKDLDARSYLFWSKVLNYKELW
jgi:hypothetical protein